MNSTSETLVELQPKGKVGSGEVAAGMRKEFGDGVQVVDGVETTTEVVLVVVEVADRLRSVLVEVHGVGVAEHTALEDQAFVSNTRCAARGSPIEEETPGRRTLVDIVGVFRTPRIDEVEEVHGGSGVVEEESDSEEQADGDDDLDSAVGCVAKTSRTAVILVAASDTDRHSDYPVSLDRNSDEVDLDG